MKINIHHKCEDYGSYAATRVKNMFNVDSGNEFKLEADLPIEDMDWQIGVIVGPSGSGKTSIGARIFGPRHSIFKPRGWPKDRPIIEVIDGLCGNFDTATGSLSAVGLGNVPAWLRPYPVLSNGEKFRANLARIIATEPDKIVIDEFTSELDRQVARFGALAFAKAWRRTEGQRVLLTPHRDVLAWLKPDWIFDTATGKFAGRCLQRRPKIKLEIYETSWKLWPFFEPHHYLKANRLIAATYYVGVSKGEPVAFVGMSPRPGMRDIRIARLVVLPDWQGAGIGRAFIDHLAERMLRGLNRFKRRMATTISTAHPGLCKSMRRDPRWVQISAALCGTDKAASSRSLTRMMSKKKGATRTISGYGGHFRAIQGFRFVGRN